jgi:hypothetical protein
MSDSESHKRMPFNKSGSEQEPFAHGIFVVFASTSGLHDS